MAFSFAITKVSYFGDKKIVYGTFTNAGGSTGGDIKTGLINCELLQLQHTGAAVAANAPVVNETFPVAGGEVTVVTDADKSGSFIAYGY
jgi:hypothetical protein